MPNLTWILLPIAICALGLATLLVRFLYQMHLQGRDLSERLAALELLYLQHHGSAPSASRQLAESPALTVSNLFELRFIFAKVVQADEYGLKGTRFEPEDAVLDVGAHIGSFAYLAHQLGSRSIHSFEALPRNYALLQRNLGSVPGISLMHAAVWRSDRPNPRTLFISPPNGENTGAPTLLAGGQGLNFETQTRFAAEQEATPVPCIAFDELLKRFDRVALVKLDCEGSEFPILLTSQELHRVDRIVGEVHEVEEAMMAGFDDEARIDGYASYRREHLIRRLESLGFEVTTRFTGPKMYLFDAKRRELRRAVS